MTTPVIPAMLHLSVGWHYTNRQSHVPQPVAFRRNRQGGFGGTVWGLSQPVELTLRLTEKPHKGALVSCNGPRAEVAVCRLHPPQAVYLCSGTLLIIPFHGKAYNRLEEREAYNTTLHAGAKGASLSQYLDVLLTNNHLLVFDFTPRRRTPPRSEVHTLIAA